MKKLLTYFSVFVILTIGFSCQPTYHEKAIKQVDSLITIVNITSRSLSEIDTIATEKSLRTIQQNLRFIQENYTDTMDRETAKFLTDHRVTKKSLTKLVKTHREQKLEVKFALGQLNRLKTDVTNGIVRPEEFKQYYLSELQAIQRIQETNSNLHDWAESAVNQFEKRNPRVQEIINKLKQQKGQ